MFTVVPAFIPKLGSATVDNVIELSRRLHFQPWNIVEIGVGHANDSKCHGYLADGASATMFEPVPDFYESLVARFGANKNVTLVNAGVYHTTKLLPFADKLQSSYIAELTAAPEISNNYHWQRTNVFLCQCVCFENYDNGSFDMALIDAEGCDWYALSQFKSRPYIISIETGAKGGYENPFCKEIAAWMETNGYEEAAKDSSDTLYVKK